MIQELDLKLLPAEAADEGLIRQRAADRSGWPVSELSDLEVIRRSIDARGSRPVFRLRVRI
ncbi:MAG: FAD-binding protein, partial [Saprospiraceae bacterium]|nr:FAD-binding protein [Saprospiraceae bacterium]